MAPEYGYIHFHVSPLLHINMILLYSHLLFQVCCPRISGVMTTPSSTTTRGPSPIPTVSPPTPNPSPELGDRFYSEPPPDISNHQNIDLLPKRCGNGDEDKLIGGNRTGIFEFPWMALLSYRTRKDQLKLLWLVCISAAV